MKLISCHIDAFGKLKNVDFDFNDEMNVFYEKNGFGKTTLAHFIKAMFYSLPASSKRISRQTVIYIDLLTLMVNLVEI